MAKNSSGIDDSKFVALSDIFGTTDWRSEFYVSRPSQGSLFGGADDGEQRVANREDMSNFARKRLSTLFRYVSEPLPLTVGNMDRYFELYCLSNTKSDPALTLIKKGVNDIITRRSHQGRR
jgi:hypothetical protein